MKTRMVCLMLAAAFGAAAADGALAQSKGKAGAAQGACATKHGKGWAWTEGMARFQAWEIIAQTTGNWPIQSDVFKNERYRCRPDGSGYTCYSRIDVCRKG